MRRLIVISCCRAGLGGRLGGVELDEEALKAVSGSFQPRASRSKETYKIVIRDPCSRFRALGFRV